MRWLENGDGWPHNQLGWRLRAKIERGLGTERARLGTFRGFGTERARLGTFRGFGTERARLATFMQSFSPNGEGGKFSNFEK